MHVLLTALVLGCTGKSADTGDSHAGPLSFTPDLPTTACAQGHNWLSTAEMGALVYEELDWSLSLSKEAINQLLSSNGLTEYAPVNNGVQTWRVRYTTQDRGVPTEATGFVFLPDIEDSQELPLLLYTHPLMGFSDDCAPTALGLEGAGIPLLMSAMGLVVAAPDYLGMRGFGDASTEVHPAILAEPTAIVSLDSLRAAMRLAASESSQAQPDPTRTLLWGASEGGFAALWSERYRPHYAPQFETLGVVAAIPPTNLQGLTQLAATHPSPSTAAVAGILVGMDQWYEQDGLLGILNPDLAEALPQELMQVCSDFPSAADATEITDFFDPDFARAAQTAAWEEVLPWSCFLEESSLTTSQVPMQSTAPTLIITAEDDDLAWPQPAHTDIPILCEQGYAIEHVQCAGADHVEGAVDTLPLQFSWLMDRIAGAAPNTDCRVTEAVDCDAE